MSNLKTRTQEILEAGEAERGNWQPTPDSVPVRLYKYWAKHSSKVPERENFCHYWRVVGIWAPATAVRRTFWKSYDTIVDVLEGKSGIVISIMSLLFILNAFLFGPREIVLGILFITFSILFLMGGAVLGLFAALEGMEDEEKAVKILFWATAPVSLPAYGLGMLAEWTGSVWNETATKAVMYGLLGLAVATGVFSLGVAFLAIYQEYGWIGTIISLAFAGGIIATGAGFAKLAQYLSGRRVIQERERRRLREEKEEQRLADIRRMLDDGSYWEMKEKEMERERIEYELSQIPKPPRSKSKIEKFLSGTADMVIFTAQVVRVKKWRVCPFVTIPKD